MPHLKDGSPAAIGQIVQGQGQGNHPHEILGTLYAIKEGEFCNGAVLLKSIPGCSSCKGGLHTAAALGVGNSVAIELPDMAMEYVTLSNLLPVPSPTAVPVG